MKLLASALIVQGFIVYSCAFAQSYTRVTDIQVSTSMNAPTNLGSATEAQLKDWRRDGSYEISVIPSSLEPIKASCAMYRNVPGFPFFGLINLDHIQIVNNTAQSHAYDAVYVVNYQSGTNTLHYTYRHNLPTIVTNLSMSCPLWLSREALGNHTVLTGTGSVSICVVATLGETAGAHVGNDEYLERFYVRQRSNIVTLPIIIQ